MNDSNLTNKVQVLIDDSDLQTLNFLIFRKAFLNNEKAMPISSYIRDIIKDHIKTESKEQLSYAQIQVQKAFDKTNTNINTKEDGTE